MALRYTGRAATLVVNGHEYHPGDVVQISQADALKLAASSRLHTFEEISDSAPAQKTADKKAD